MRLLLWFLLLTGIATSQPRHVYLTWQSPDTSTEITVVFQTVARVQNPQVRFQVADSAEAAWKSVPAQTHRFPNGGRLVHFVRLQGLQPARRYRFVAGDEAGGFSAERHFATLPQSGPVRLVTGGDMSMTREAREMMKVAAATAPMAALIGGDIAYANGRLDRQHYWDIWLDNWEELMVTPSGLTIPLVLAIGNHDVRGGFGGQPDEAPFYFGFFQQHERTYFERHLGEHIGLVVLDTGHVAEHGPPQSLWLARTLQAWSHKRYRLALYHVPLYPSHRSFSHRHHSAGREHWIEPFDRHRLTAAFENHEHTFKRSHRLRRNRLHPQGVLYLGDGCWGRPPRSVDSERRWYEARAEGRTHVWLVEASSDEIRFRALGLEGATFDTVTVKADESSN